MEMVGRSVSNYEIVEKLGEGGMGVVYRARDTTLGRFVALKFLPPRIVSSPEQIARFRREARAISALNHPHIATIHGMEEAGEFIFLILEYLPGGSLRQKLAGTKSSGDRLSIDDAIEWTIQIGEGLAHAHKQGIVHRDVKASNVLFTGEGQIKIADFGLAKIVAEAESAEASELTDPGHTVGTPPSMSPEQTRGLKVDERTDIFSLGVVLFEMIAGEMPFQAPDKPALLHEVAYTPAPPLSRFRTGVPDTLQAIVSKMLEKNADARYQTVNDALADLRSVRDQMGSAGSRQRTLEETATMTAASTPRRRRWSVAMAAIGIPILIAAAIPDVRDRLRDWIHPQPIPAKKEIAVLPFSNIGGDPKNETLVDGLMEWVSTSLTGLEDHLLVVPASEVRKENVTNARDAEKLLHANLAIAGSVQSISDRVQVTLNLVDTHTGTQLRAETIKTDPDLADVQDSVREKVERMLEVALQPQAAQALKAGQTNIPGAFRFYVDGLGYLKHYERPGNLDNAIAAFNRALAVDRNYVLAHAGKAEAYWREYDLGKDPLSIDTALFSGQRALDLNDRVARVHITMGMIQVGKGQYERAESEFNKALALEPRSADAYREFALAYEKMGRLDTAEGTYQRAIKARSGDWSSLKQLGRFYFYQGRNPEAEDYFLRVISLTPNSANAYSNLGVAYLKDSREEDARKALEHSVALEPTESGCSNLGSRYYMEGRYEDAADQYKKALVLNPTGSLWWGNLADAYRWTPTHTEDAVNAYQHAIGYLEKEILINSNDAHLHARLATSLAALGTIETAKRAVMDRERAASEIKTALRQSPADGYVSFRAALVYEQNHQRELALSSLKSTLDANYSLEEILHAPPLKDLREDPKFSRLVAEKKRAASGHNPPH
jgi:serine/threonine protein kinase/tetratricopeptide (TPR) repeat protein